MTHTAIFKLASDPPFDAIEVELPELTTELPDGSTGYFQRRQDDCWRAAVATALQVPYEEVPDWSTQPESHAQELAAWQEVGEWVWSRGYRLLFHDGTPSDEKATFIGVGPADSADRYRHVVACRGGHVFEPGSGFRLPGWMRLQPLSTIEFSISFERTDEK